MQRYQRNEGLQEKRFEAKGRWMDFVIVGGLFRRGEKCRPSGSWLWCPRGPFEFSVLERLSNPKVIVNVLDSA